MSPAQRNGSGGGDRCNGSFECLSMVPEVDLSADDIAVPDDGSKHSAIKPWRPPPILRPPSVSLFADSEEDLLPLTVGGGAALDGSPADGRERGSQRTCASPMSLVAPGLYVGDAAAASDLDAIHSAGITHVLNCSHLPNPHEGVDRAAHAYLQLGLLDNLSDLPRMHDALAKGVHFIDGALKTGGTVLVHCRAGISRSATLAIAYLVRATKQPVHAVLERLRAKRSVVDPNFGYFVALSEWEQHELLLCPHPGSTATAATRATAAGGDGTGLLRWPGTSLRGSSSTPPLRAITPGEGMPLESQESQQTLSE